MHRALRNCALLLCLSALLTACERSSPEAMLDNYSERVARVLEESIDNRLDSAPAITLLPPRRQRLLPLTDLRQGLIEVLALRHCNLLGLIAQRNSSLGKVMLPSKQLVYEMRLLSQVRDCRAQLAQSVNAHTDKAADAQLIQQLDSIYSLKARELPAVLWNAIYASREMESNFSIGDPPLPLSLNENQSDGSEAALLSLQALAELQTLIATPNWQLPTGLDQLEQHYQTLEANRFGSQWLKSVWLLSQTLELTAQALDRREQRRPICPQQSPTPRARILLNVFNKYYAGEVQPYMARVDRSGQRWKALHQQLLSSLPATAAMRDYQWRIFADTNPDSLWQAYIRARDHHIRSWQTTLRYCNLMPSR